MLKAKKLTLSDFEFNAYASKSIVTPAQTMRGCAEEEIKSFCDSVVDMKKKANVPWGWCDVKVTGVLLDDHAFEDAEELGGCSYQNKAAFIDSGYYDDMCKEIVASVQKKLDQYVLTINQKISNGLIGYAVV